MSRDVIHPPFYAPGGALCPVEIEYQLVDENKDPIIGMRASDGIGITCKLVITTSDQNQTISLTTQDDIYGTTYWRTRVGLIGADSIPLTSRCAKYDEYFVALPSGAPIDFDDYLNLGTGGVPGQPPGYFTPTLPFYLTDGSGIFLPLTDDFALPFYLTDGASAPLPLVQG